MGKGQVCGGERVLCTAGELCTTTVSPWPAPGPTWQGRDGLCYTWRGTMRPHRQLGDQPVQQVLWRKQVDVSRASSSQRLPSALCKESEAASQGTQEHRNRLAMSALGTRWNAQASSCSGAAPLAPRPQQRARGPGWNGAGTGCHCSPPRGSRCDLGQVHSLSPSLSSVTWK